jgi:hypothetical protein
MHLTGGPVTLRCGSRWFLGCLQSVSDNAVHWHLVSRMSRRGPRAGAQAYARCIGSCHSQRPLPRDFVRSLPVARCHRSSVRRSMVEVSPNCKRHRLEEKPVQVRVTTANGCRLLDVIGFSTCTQRSARGACAVAGPTDLSEPELRRQWRLPRVAVASGSTRQIDWATPERRARAELVRSAADNLKRTCGTSQGPCLDRS